MVGWIAFLVIVVFLLAGETVLRLLVGDPHYDSQIQQVKRTALHQERSIDLLDKGKAQEHKHRLAMFNDLDEKINARTMSMDEPELKRIFSYHSPSPDQVERMESIRLQCHELGLTLLRSVPDSTELVGAIHQLEMVSTLANAGIVRREPPNPDDSDDIPF